MTITSEPRGPPRLLGLDGSEVYNATSLTGLALFEGATIGQRASRNAGLMSKAQSGCNSTTGSG